MRLYDTHAHFEDGDDIDAIARRAAEAGVSRFLAVGGSESLNRNALRSGETVALGWDRDQTGNTERCLKHLKEVLAQHQNRVVAIGEIGLDCHYSADTLNAQLELFEAQLELAGSLAKPAVIHTREARDATLSAIDNISWPHGGKLRGIIHSFTGELDFARELLDRGFMISFSGIATFHSAAELRQTARYIPDDRILVETDSPYLAPVPVRGRRCEPSFVAHTAKAIAAERGTPIEIFSELTFLNALSLLGDPQNDAAI